MKPLALILLLAAAAVTSAPAAELSPEVLKRAKTRIDTLLNSRRGATPPPAAPANPFVLPPSAAPAEGPAPVNDAPLTKADALTKLAATLNVSGYVQIQGVPHLIINRMAYKENNLVPVRDAGGSVTFLLLKNITESEFTLELDGIELPQKHTSK